MVKVYYARIFDYEAHSAAFWQSRVAPETWQAARAFGNAHARLTKLLGEVMLRTLLYEFCGLSAEVFRIRRGAHGKPYLEGVAVPLYFNISHSGDYIVLALSDREVGIDVERQAVARMAVARRFFHPDELRMLEALPPEARDEWFFRLWVAKESFLKYTGTGLSASLHSFRVCFDSGEAVIWKKEERVDVCLHSSLLVSGYPCCICSPSADMPEFMPFVSTDIPQSARR